MATDRVLLTDVDNTLFSWIDFFAPCFRALVHVVAREARVGEDELYDAFQVTFTREGSVEYRRAIQDNVLIQQLPQAEQDRIVELGAKVFGGSMRRHLKPYPDVIPTLRRLKLDDVRVVAVTNSGALQAIDRLRRLGLATLLDGAVAWNHDVAGHADTDDDYAEAVLRRTRRSGLGWVHAVATSELKPNPASYRTALSTLRAHDAQVWIVGDSLQKDLSAAAELGATSIWAKYGHAFEQRNFETLLRITHWSEEKIRTAYDTEVLVPDYVSESFSEVLELIELRQGQLF